jgi:predicted esterase
VSGPHQGQPVLSAGEPLERAEAAMVLLHGRGAPAEDMLGLAAAFEVDGYAYLAPQAAGYTWYPNRFLAPIESNEPWLSSALDLVAGVLEHLGGAGIPPERVVVGGFSQGACLTLEFAVRNPRRWGGVVGLSGGLIGPPGSHREVTGSLDGTPLFLGCSDVDPHIPLQSVEEAASVLAEMGARVTKRIYPGMPHTVNDDEVGAVRALLLEVLGRTGEPG